MEDLYRETIKKLVNEHYERNISMSEYRIKRRELIDQMDNEFNGSKTIHNSENMNSVSQSE